MKIITKYQSNDGIVFHEQAECLEYERITANRPSSWLPITAESKPEEKVMCWTKIHDEDGLRNEAILYRNGKLWFRPAGCMYVYYTPTHWAKP